MRVFRSLKNFGSAWSGSSFISHSAFHTRHSESGMTMLAVMAVMTIFAIALLAVAPAVQLEVQREKELESIRRGEDVAEAIKRFIIHHQGRKLPESIDQLLEGLPQGTKKCRYFALRQRPILSAKTENGG